jgi:hypothetical protein
MGEGYDRQCVAGLRFACRCGRECSYADEYGNVHAYLSTDVYSNEHANTHRDAHSYGDVDSDPDAHKHRHRNAC